nr:protein-cysteine N-palmitoyltransferase HHAT-like [Lytechinus pictus]
MALRNASVANSEMKERKPDVPSASQGEEHIKEEKESVRACQRSSPQLPIFELLLYGFVVITVYCYATFKLFKASQDFQIKTINGRGLLQPGWDILGRRYQDMMPGEWIHWQFFTLHPISLALYAGHLIGGLFVSKYLPNLRKSFLICSSVMSTAVIVSPQVFGLLLLHAIIAYLVAILGRRTWLIWITVLSQLSFTVVGSFSQWQISLLPGIREYRVKFIIAMAFCCLRFIAFGVGYVKQQGDQDESSKDESKKDKEDSWTIWDYLLYVFYLPTSTHGPFMTPQTFLLQIKNPYHPSSMKEFRWVCLMWLRPLLCAIFLEFIHHFIYFSSFMLLPQYLEKLPVLALLALGEWCTIIFQLQYMVYYGFAKAMAIFDGVLTPGLPACMQTILMATHGWRYFDRGEYQFILRNIYIPFGGSQHGGLRQYFALLISYCFTSFWHGFNYHIIVMVLIFWVLVQWEAFSPIIAKKLGVQIWIGKMSPLSRRRLDCLLTGGKYPLLVLAMIFFINNIEVGKIFVSRVLGAEGALWVIGGLLGVHYCHVQLVEEFFCRCGKKYIMEKYYMAPPKL